ncbi:iron-siderophore ABC transporter substrate-binding protein [Aeromicrobium sp. 50.2.37]|uniref:ABC transporter substrate-binding protein n=1 Tax=Aeromicrobium sp. 50.2.37 TaxID=2969305 RepID=UPI002150466B|nr:iron-siderophore ABC transporter substrate-binding protein [Aeromicrobium sp. 50.2.37]MCR4512575.1 iron-siderophore ABC transporter substrate-binding protein [Aeromicrobium sp. 50.2.37]
MTSIRLPLVAATALLATVLAACGTTEDASDGSSESSGEKITLTDSRGKEITLDGPATRVAATEWNAAEYLVSLGVQPVGVSDVKGFATWDSAVKLDGDVTDLGTRGEPSLDTLASLDLDALVVTDTLAGDAVEQIEKTIPVIVLPGGKAGEQIDQMFANLDLVAKATGTEDEAKELKAEFEEKLADTKQAVADSDAAGATVAFSDAYDTGDAVSVRPYTATSQLGTILGELGFENAWDAIDGLEPDPAYGLAQTDVEGLTKLPDDTQYWYIANDAETDPYADTLKDNTVWTSLPFVESGDVVRFPDKIWMFGGPTSMIQFLDAVADQVS